jgi:protein-disulfide isomerase-like protein with CxxC motif
LDVYDPWSYAYLPSVGEVLSAAAPQVAVEVVNSGRYAGWDVADLAPRAAAVAASTETRFGAPFVDLMTRGGARIDAERAAAGVIGLLAAGDVSVDRVLRAVQDEFFLRGRLLDAPGVLRSIGDGLGLDGHAIEVFAQTPRAHELAVEDFAMAVDFDEGGGPLLLASHAGHVFEFDGLGATGERLMDQFRSVMARP